MRIYHRSFIVSVILFCATFFACLTVEAQEEEEEWTAEINAYIRGDIPSIKVSKWTPINITIQDAFGINWDKLKETPFLPEWYMRLVWPLNPMFPQPVQRFLGYTSIRFEPEIVEGNPRGWFLRVIPTAVTDSNTGDIHNITLEAQADDSAVDYAVVVGIKCTRIDTLGGELGSSYIYVPIKASPTNFVEMRATQTTKRAGLKSMVYFTIDITNNGYYKDVFQFELDEENGLMGLFNEQAVVMNPGETKRVTLGVLTPEKLWDPGTANKIDVYVYSAGDPTRTLVGTLVVWTEGIYISPLVGIILAPILVILLIVYFLLFYIKERRDIELYGKPEKPWNIPEEKKHLEELKQKDMEEYEKVRRMMIDEYRSAMLWYNSYRESLEKPKKDYLKPLIDILVKSKKWLKKIFKKPKKPRVSNYKLLQDFFKKPRKKKPKKEEKPVKKKEKPKAEKKKELSETEKLKMDQRKRDKAIQKIKLEQKRQMKRIKKK